LDHDLKVEVHIVTLMPLVVYCLPIDLKIPESPTGWQRNELDDLSGLIIFDFKTVGVTVGVVLVKSESEGFKLFEVDDFLLSF
jgi:hypothetical protein